MKKGGLAISPMKIGLLNPQTSNPKKDYSSRSLFPGNLQSFWLTDEKQNYRATVYWSGGGGKVFFETWAPVFSHLLSQFSFAHIAGILRSPLFGKGYGDMLFFLPSFTPCRHCACFICLLSILSELSTNLGRVVRCQSPSRRPIYHNTSFRVFLDRVTCNQQHSVDVAGITLFRDELFLDDNTAAHGISQYINTLTLLQLASCFKA